MLTIISFLVFGIILGFLLKRKKALIQASKKLTDWTICLFLFFFGLSAGGNKAIMNNFTTVGIVSLALAIGGILGSVFLSYFVYKYLFKNKNERQF